MESIEGINSARPEKIKKYEEALWQRAEEFSIIRQALQQKVDELERLFHERPLHTLNLYKQEVRGKEEREYQEIKDEIEKIIKEEKRLEEGLLNLASGILNKKEIESLIPSQDEEEVRISKRKRQILEDKRRLGVDPRDIISEMYGEFGAEKMHLTTGRHVRTVKNLGSIDSLDAAAKFYFQTTDTHGGKVAYGKRSPSYISPSGKRIRKK